MSTVPCKKREDYLEWPEYFMAVAFLSAQRSKDPNSQVRALSGRMCCVPTCSCLSVKVIIRCLRYLLWGQGCSSFGLWELPPKTSKDTELVALLDAACPFGGPQAPGFIYHLSRSRPATLSHQAFARVSLQVGACIVNAENKIVGIGYNGMPNGCSDDLLPWRRTAERRLDTKYPYGRTCFVLPPA